MLLRAYGLGIFPMAESRDDPRLFWVDPDMRGIIPLDIFHASRRLARRVRSGVFEPSIDSDFPAVIEACAEPRPGHPETWINDQIVALYTALFQRGHVHTVECWREGHLVGGLYGVSLRGTFFGESMFSRETDASKVALVHLVARLRKGGFQLLDTQFVTRHLSQFGAVEIHRSGYRQLLSSALDVKATFYSELDGSEFEEFLQSTTQTS